ncbi:MAG TPA: PP2C family protein-serine/threonine phosphatase [Thermoanaerobaculia bacterium]|nr:PP2C family protein-serine/threonine phosphatase [Thermoanaerobaculia bacterium]
MRIAPFDELLDLTPDAAVERWSDGRNYQLVRWFVAPAALVALVVLIQALGAGAPLRALAAALALALPVASYLLRGRPSFARRFRAILLAGVAGEILFLAGTAAEEATFSLPLFLFAPLLLVRLRLRARETLLLAGLVVAAAVGRALLGSDAELARALPGMATGAFFVNGGAAATGIWLSRRQRREFRERFVRDQGRERERRRMRGELADARAIQLAMLPAHLPAVSWAEAEASSVPASEVGGDYYDAFLIAGPLGDPLARGGLALVVGDVAGHGVASGLMLSGVRSCLYLLRDELAHPLPVIARLNEVVREFRVERLFMSLLLARLSPDGDLLLVSAGHPPALLARRAGGAVERLGAPAPPLGTQLPASFSECRARLVPGDLLLLYSDGVPETAREDGERFGDERLARALARQLDGRPAWESVAALGEELARFRGSAPQEDDVTLLALRYLGPRRGPDPAA